MLNVDILPPSKFAGVGVIATVVLDFFGIPLKPIVWALVGGFLGSGFAKPTGFVKSVGVYLSASLLSALFGHTVAQHYFPDSDAISSTLSALCSLMFHPALAVFIEKLPMIFDAIVGALGRKGTP